MIGRAVYLTLLIFTMTDVDAESKLMGPDAGSVIYETKYRFFVSTYDPKAVFDPTLVDRVTDEILHTTDQLAARAFGHRAAGDVAGYLRLATESFAREFNVRIKAESETLTEIAEKWRREMRNAQVELTHHVFYGSDEVIRYSIIDKESGNKRSSGFLYFERGQSGRWMLGDLPPDSLLRRWRVDDVREFIEIEE